MMCGGYAWHGKTYHDYNDPGDELIWWPKGGQLHGEAWIRLKWIRQLLKKDVKHGLTMMGHFGHFSFDRISIAQDGAGGTRFIYFGEHQPRRWTTGLPNDGGDYDVDVMNTWEMTVEPAKIVSAHQVPPTRHGNVTRGGGQDADFGVELPARLGLAIRARRKV